MSHVFQTLNEKVYRDYSDKKKQGLLSVIVDTKSGLVYPIPKNMEHLDFVCSLLKVTKDKLKAEPEMAAHLVPSLIKVDEEEGQITGIVTGISSLESGGSVRHTNETLKLGHYLIHRFVEGGEIPLAAKLREDKIVYRFARG